MPRKQRRRRSENRPPRSLVPLKISIELCFVEQRGVYTVELYAREDPLGGVTLLPRPRFILHQDLVDGADPLTSIQTQP
jgi:hypothetical protein